VQARRELGDDRDAELDPRRGAQVLEEHAKVTTLDELGDDERAVLEPVEVHDLEDVAMMKARGHARLIDEHERGALVRDQLGPDQLDHDRAFEPVLGHEPAAIDLAHATLSKERSYFIPAELREHVRG